MKSAYSKEKQNRRINDTSVDTKDPPILSTVKKKIPATEHEGHDLVCESEGQEGRPWKQRHRYTQSHGQKEDKTGFIGVASADEGREGRWQRTHPR